MAAGKEPIPSDAELRFIEAVSSGTVHIAVKYGTYDIARSPQVSAVSSGGSAFIALALHPTVTRCGRRTFPQAEKDHQGTDRFSDDQLCAACYRTLTPEDQERAFEHKQPEGA
ncbi:hypothetical protein ACFYXD_34915 [Streptomyces platensis]|uniref:hypothetical protein n=1 Tax=Streptomyces platensis TaxID=58346 RepID=UPI00368831EE